MPLGESGKLSLFIPNFAGGGAERVMITLAGGFVRAGRVVDLLTADAEGPYRAEVPEGVRVVDFGTGRVVKALPKLCRYLRQERPGVLMSTLTHANVVSLIAKSVTGVETRVFVREANVLSVRSPGGPLRGRMLPLLARGIYRLADGIVAPSIGVADELAASHRIPRRDVHVIYNPVVDERLFALARERPSHPWADLSDPPLIVGVGRLSAQKDFATLIRAFRRVRAVRPARLLILGEGEQRTMLQKLVADLGLEKDVSLAGFADNPFAIMARASVFVLSSAFEGLPNALVQAFALGAPIVATDCPSGPREILQEGRYGVLVPVGDDAAMAAGILQKLDAKRDAESQRSASNRFHVSKVTDEYLALFGADQGRCGIGRQDVDVA